jgi:hypothetical protein
MTSSTSGFFTPSGWRENIRVFRVVDDHLTRRFVVNRDGPELFNGRIGRNVQAVRLAAPSTTRHPCPDRLAVLELVREFRRTMPMQYVVTGD